MNDIDKISEELERISDLLMHIANSPRAYNTNAAGLMDIRSFELRAIANELRESQWQVQGVI